MFLRVSAAARVMADDRQIPLKTGSHLQSEHIAPHLIEALCPITRFAFQTWFLRLVTKGGKGNRFSGVPKKSEARNREFRASRVLIMLTALIPLWLWDRSCSFC